MFDRLISILLDLWDRLTPCIIIDQYNGGVRLRFGKYKENIEPGLLWKIPFADNILTCHIVWTTINLPPQSLVTSDEVNIVVSAVVKYRVSDVKIYLLEVNDSIDAISDMTQGAIKKAIMSKTWAECRSEELDNELTKKARAEARRWGIEVSGVTLANIGVIRSIRLFNDSTQLT